MKLYPFDQVIASARERMMAGMRIHLQFNCDNCGMKQTFEQEDYLSERGQCEECGHITSLKDKGCNLMVISGGKRI
jgi:uncharacterized protein (DUF983 family)